MKLGHLVFQPLIDDDTKECYTYANNIKKEKFTMSPIKRLHFFLGLMFFTAPVIADEFIIPSPCTTPACYKTAQLTEWPSAEKKAGQPFYFGGLQLVIPQNCTLKIIPYSNSVQLICKQGKITIGYVAGHEIEGQAQTGFFKHSQYNVADIARIMFTETPNSHKVTQRENLWIRRNAFSLKKSIVSKNAELFLSTLNPYTIYYCKSCGDYKIYAYLTDNSKPNHHLEFISTSLDYEWFHSIISRIHTNKEKQ